MPKRLLFKYTSKSRKDNFFRGLDSIVDNLSNKEDYYIQCTFDENDAQMNNAEVIERLHTYKNLVYYFGESISKIDAINKNLDKVSAFDIIIAMSDDIIFTATGFDNIIRQDMPEDLDCFLHYPDGNHNGDILSTLNIVGRSYFQRTGYIYHPDYVSVYSDQEETEKAKMLAKHKFVNNNIFDHLHPVFKKAQWDSQYIATENPIQYAKDRDTYFRRKRKNFDI